MIETERLKLVPLNHSQVMLYKHEPERLADELKVRYIPSQQDPAVQKDLDEAIVFWLAGTLNHPDKFEWYTNWVIILKQVNVSVGGIGFAGFPDHDGKSMVGYGLDLQYHGKGIATEALKAIIQWGFMEHSLKKIIADTPIKNIPSQRVLVKNQFSETGKNDSMIYWTLERS
jgi:[ribosomal protein S5]-alanine N-acetyltransferase